MRFPSSDPTIVVECYDTVLACRPSFASHLRALRALAFNRRRMHAEACVTLSAAKSVNGVPVSTDLDVLKEPLWDHLAGSSLHGPRCPTCGLQVLAPATAASSSWWSCDHMPEAVKEDRASTARIATALLSARGSQSSTDKESLARYLSEFCSLLDALCSIAKSMLIDPARVDGGCQERSGCCSRHQEADRLLEDLQSGVSCWVVDRSFATETRLLPRRSLPDTVMLRRGRSRFCEFLDARRMHYPADPPEFPDFDVLYLTGPVVSQMPALVSEVEKVLYPSPESSEVATEWDRVCAIERNARELEESIVSAMTHGYMVPG